jgi:succinyl-CoA synthetase alpha subunit
LPGSCTRTWSSVSPRIRSRTIILIGGIGGQPEEEDATGWIMKNRPTKKKPVGSYIAGAIVSGGRGTAEGKCEALAAGPCGSRSTRAISGNISSRR